MIKRPQGGFWVLIGATIALTVVVAVIVKFIAAHRVAVTRRAHADRQRTWAVADQECVRLATATHAPGIAVIVTTGAVGFGLLLIILVSGLLIAFAALGVAISFGGVAAGTLVRTAASRDANKQPHDLRLEVLSLASPDSEDIIEEHDALDWQWLRRE